MMGFKLKKIVTFVVSAVIMVGACAFSSDSVSTNASGAQSRVYRKYTRSTGEISAYVLTQSEYSGVNSRSIIGGEDNRQYSDNQKYMTGVVTLGSGAGFIVGENLLATNAHVVSNRPNGYIYTDDYKVILYNDDGSEYGRFSVESVHVPENYFTISDGTHAYYDYALVTLQGGENIDWDNFGCFDMGIALDGIINKSTKLTVASHISKDGVFGLYEGEGSINEMNEFRIKYDCDTIGGQSGSPVIASRNYNGETYDTVVAIHAAGGNWGVRVTSPILQFFYNNSNI